MWDEVLEYRVWCHPERGAEDLFEGDDYYYTFETCEEALAFSESKKGTEEPLALILQKEHINEPEPGVFEHVKEERVTEWCVDWLSRSKRSDDTIPRFMQAEGDPNRMNILRASDRDA